MNDKAKHVLNGRGRSPYKHTVWSRVADLCQCAPEDALRQLETARAGLTEEQVETWREQYGLNEVSHSPGATLRARRRNRP
jgi:cation transport ATPase-like protein